MNFSCLYSYIYCEPCNMHQINLNNNIHGYSFATGGLVMHSLLDYFYPFYNF